MEKESEPKQTARMIQRRKMSEQNTLRWTTIFGNENTKHQEIQHLATIKMAQIIKEETRQSKTYYAQQHRETNQKRHHDKQQSNKCTQQGAQITIVVLIINNITCGVDDQTKAISTRKKDDNVRDQTSYGR